MVHVLVRNGRPNHESTWTADEQVQDALWETAERCWAFAPEERPLIGDVVQDLSTAFIVIVESADG